MRRWALPPNRAGGPARCALSLRAPRFFSVGVDATQRRQAAFKHADLLARAGRSLALDVHQYAFFGRLQPRFGARIVGPQFIEFAGIIDARLASADSRSCASRCRRSCLATITFAGDGK